MEDSIKEKIINVVLEHDFNSTIVNYNIAIVGMYPIYNFNINGLSISLHSEEKTIPYLIIEDMEIKSIRLIEIVRLFQEKEKSMNARKLLNILNKMTAFVND